MRCLGCKKGRKLKKGLCDKCRKYKEYLIDELVKIGYHRKPLEDSNYQDVVTQAAYEKIKGHSIISSL